MLSQADVARRAGVSLMTVSRVVNGSSKVRPDTRQKVLEAIRELSYYPNAAARALNCNRTNVLEVVIPHEDYFFSSEYFSELLFSIEKVVRERQYNLIFNTYDPAATADRALLYKQRKVDGLMIVAPSVSDRCLEGLEAEGVPLVLINGRSDRKQLCYVDVDNLHGARLAMDYLLDLGHRRIGVITGGSLVVNARDRLEGYRSALDARGVAARDEWIYQGNWSEQSGYAGLQHFLGLAQRPTAVFCCNDLMAIGAMRAAADQGVAVPEEISVIGFDDIRLASYVNPRLTTVRQPLDQVGQSAARILLDLLGEKRSAARRVVLPPELIIRASCRAP
jgi:LacI family transcriptional regulator